MVQNRKSDHIDLANKSQLSKESKNSYYRYEPLLSAHPIPSKLIPTKFLNHQLDFPFWVSSMTGGTSIAKTINHNLATVAREFRFGMALGSCRPLLSSDEFFEDFNLRPILGDDLPFFANLGIAQIEKLIAKNELHKVHAMVEKLKATGLIIHINPMQEWFQPEGDRFLVSPIETIKEFLKDKKYPVIVKEVGQGMGPKSLHAILKLEIDAIEFGAFGGTNFSLLETLRQEKINKNYSSNELVKIGHTPFEMVKFMNDLTEANPKYKNTEVIISGGIQNILEGQYYKSILNSNSVIGQAKRFLDHAQNIDELRTFVRDEINTLLMAECYLEVNGDV